MSIFSSIVDKIFHHAQTSSGQAGAGPSSQTTGQQNAGVAASPQSQVRAGSEAAGQQSSFGAATGASATLQGVDVEAVLTQLASKKGGGGNWRTSVVDLLKLLDLDSSLDARKQLATELNVHAGADGSAEQNIALQKALMAKVAENGGKVPDGLRH